MLQGALMPVMTLVFGTLAGDFADVAAGRITDAEFLRRLAHFTLYFVYLAIGEFAGSYAMWIGIHSRWRRHYEQASVRHTLLHTLWITNIDLWSRRTLLSSLLEKGIAYLDEAGTGEVTNLLGGDADAVRDALSSKLGRVIAAFTSVLVAFGIAFSRSWRLTLIMSSGLLGFAAAGGVGAYFITTFTKTSLDAQSAAATVAQEAISGISCVIANLAESLLAAKYEALLSKGHRPAILARGSGEMMIATITGIATCLFSLAFWRGSRYFVNGQANFSDIIIVLLAVLLGTAKLGLVGPNAKAVVAEATAAKKIFTALDKPTRISSGSDEGEKPSSIEGTLCFDRVSFVYPTRPDVNVLKNFDLTIPARKTTALVGASGCDKSTIIELIQRLYDPSDGNVSLDGRPLPSLSLRWLRSNIGVVSQEPDLFNTTVYNNIKYGLLHSHQHTDEETIRRRVVARAGKANIHHTILQMPDGYDTVVGERGSRLSGQSIRIPGGFRYTGTEAHQNGSNRLKLTLIYRWPAPTSGNRASARRRSTDTPARRSNLRT
jgi:ATP-binding cassette, subfamily B (MDR/TAP), member 1